MGEVNVLLVEDNPDDAELTLRALRRVNAADRLLHLNDGIKAIDWLFGTSGTELPRVVVLDLKLPGLDGLEVLRQIKNDVRTRAVPVVVLTSSKEDSDLASCYALGANSYIVKPVGFDPYMRAVSDLGRYWNELNQTLLIPS